MKFQATDEQAKQIAVNAVNASVPIGLGFLRAEDKDYTVEDIEIVRNAIDLDYFHGRMVKLGLRRSDEGEWEIIYGAEPRGDYQSWAYTYPTVEALVASVISP